MALRIRPLSEGAAPASGGGLRIRPLDDFLASPSGGGAGTPAPFQADFAYNPQPTDPNAPRPMPPEIQAMLQGTLWSDARGRQRAFWDTQEGQTPRGPNTDVITGVENGQYQTRPHPIFPVGSPAYDALVAGLAEGGGRWGAWNAAAPTPGGISDSFGRDPNFQGMTNAELANQFGHLAGRSPLAAALDLNPFSEGTPAANILGPLFGLAPGIGWMAGPVIRAMEQAAINEATRSGGLYHNEFDPSLGAPSFGFTGPQFGDARGGYAPQSFQGGGSNFGRQDPGSGDSFHTGGAVGTGAPKGPNRKAMLQEGEFVVRKDVAQKQRPLLEAINRGESTKKLKKLIDYLLVEDDAPAR